jgi:hypothetical protein
MTGPPSQIVAGERVERAKPEEEGANHQVGDIEHGKTPCESSGFLVILAGVGRAASFRITPRRGIEIASRAYKFHMD